MRSAMPGGCSGRIRLWQMCSVPAEGKAEAKVADAFDWSSKVDEFRESKHPPALNKEAMFAGSTPGDCLGCFRIASAPPPFPSQQWPMRSARSPYFQPHPLDRHLKRPISFRLRSFQTLIKPLNSGIRKQVPLLRKVLFINWVFEKNIN